MATGIRVSMTGQHEWCVMGECWDLPAGFVGIGSEKSIGVMECDKVGMWYPIKKTCEVKG